MTRTLALDGQERRAGSGGQPPIRLAVLDADTGFLQVLSKRLEGAGWQYRVLASPVVPQMFSPSHPVSRSLRQSDTKRWRSGS